MSENLKELGEFLARREIRAYFEHLLYVLLLLIGAGMWYLGMPHAGELIAAAIAAILTRSRSD